jgi:hypothetical protein
LSRSQIYAGKAENPSRLEFREFCHLIGSEEKDDFILFRVTQLVDRAQLVFATVIWGKSQFKLKLFCCDKFKSLGRQINN